MNVKNFKKGLAPSAVEGFTLVELLVVLAVISMLTSFALTSLMQARANSRDARRESDMQQMQNALAIYETANRSYPVSCTNDCFNPACPTGEVTINSLTDCLSIRLLADNAMSEVPLDPLKRQLPGPCGEPSSHAYCYVSTGDTYIIRYELETDTIPGKNKGWNSVWP